MNRDNKETEAYLRAHHLRLMLCGLCASTMLQGCASTTPTGAIAVTPIPAQAYTHQVIAEQDDKSLEGLLVYIETRKANNHAPIQYDLRILTQALEKEIKARGGEPQPHASADALTLRLEVSRYLTERLPQMPKGKRARTYLDYTSRMDHAEGRSLPPDRVHSIAGISSSVKQSHVDMITQFVRDVLTKPRTAAFLAEHRLNAEGLTRIRLARVAKELFERTRQSLSTGSTDPIRVALAPLQNDTNNRMGAQLLPHLMNEFTPPVYRFFTRTQLASILEEQSLQMMDLVDQNTTVRAGKIQGVDYMVTGSMMPAQKGTLVQIQLLSVTSGEVISSASVLTP